MLLLVSAQGNKQARGGRMDGIERRRGVIYVLRLALIAYPLCRQHTFTLLAYCEFKSVLAAAEENFLQHLKLNNGVQCLALQTQRRERGCFQNKDFCQGFNCF